MPLINGEFAFIAIHTPEIADADADGPAARRSFLARLTSELTVRIAMLEPAAREYRRLEGKLGRLRRSR